MLRRLRSIDALAAVPASDVKKDGWRGLMRTLDQAEAVVVTNHKEPEAVILSVEAYGELLTIARLAESRAASELEALRRGFDERLAALRAPDAGARLRSVMRSPSKLHGKVKAGTRY